jgi:hypothetical protein
LIRITIISQEDPVFKVYTDKGITLLNHTNGQYNFQLSLCSYNASCTSFDCLFYLFTEDSLKNISFISKYKFLHENDKFSKDEIAVTKFYINDTPSFKILYFVITGSYKNMDNSKSYHLNDTYYYDKNDNEFGSITRRTKDQINEIINNNNKYQLIKSFKLF